jgi:hypothetical protein
MFLTSSRAARHEGDESENPMKRGMATAAAALVAAMSIAAAQGTPASATHTDRSDKTAQPTQPLAAAKTKKASQQHASAKTHRNMRETTGVGHDGTIVGPQQDPSIHQSFGRDSRGTPKGNGQN